jgi:hypothetical protein
MRRDIITQLVFHNQVLPPDVLTIVAIGEYGVGLIQNDNSTIFVQNLLYRLQNVITRKTNLMFHVTIFENPL